MQTEYLAEIAFFQGEEAEPFLKGINRKGPAATIRYMSWFDSGTYCGRIIPQQQRKIHSSHEWSGRFTVENSGTYFMVWSDRYQYVSLEKVMSEQEYRSVTVND